MKVTLAAATVLASALSVNAFASQEPAKAGVAPQKPQERQRIQSYGSVNSTVWIASVPESTIREAVPAQYSLLPIDKALFPDFVERNRPLLIVAGQNHNLTAHPNNPPFALARVQAPYIAKFPDSKSPFTYELPILASSAEVVGIVPSFLGIPATHVQLDPALQGSEACHDVEGACVFNAKAAKEGADALSFAARASEEKGWSEEQVKTLLEMPSFVGLESTYCDKYTETAKSGEKPQNVVADITLQLTKAGMTSPLIVKGAKGVRTNKNFVGDYFFPCEQFKA